VRIAVAAPKAKYHGPSHDSHRLLAPAGGGLSLNSKPPGSCFPAVQKLSDEDPLAGFVPVDTCLRICLDIMDVMDFDTDDDMVGPVCYY
jgi:hypothetical protein